MRESVQCDLDDCSKARGGMGLTIRGSASSPSTSSRQGAAAELPATGADSGRAAPDSSGTLKHAHLHPAHSYT